MKTPPPDIAQIVKCIRILAHDINRRWERNKTTWGIAGNADRILHHVDVYALRRCIDFVLDQPPKDGIKGYRAAEMLNGVLKTIETNRRAIESELVA